MFIKYQNVRNTIVGTVAAVGAGVGAIFGFGNGAEEATKPRDTHAAVAVAHDDRASESIAPVTPQPEIAKPEVAKSSPRQSVAKPVLAEADPIPEQAARAEPVQQQRALTKEDRYAQAMKIANAKAPGRFGKDVLGPASPWKLNLYDDDGDGQWNRAKLDFDRDDVDDEKWNFKKGRWEKTGGHSIWVGNAWTAGDVPEPVAQKHEATTKSPERIAVEAEWDRYRQAMKLANSPAAPSGKGKDVLGPSSPWKLNLYDDDKDGKWERAKLDTNRDGKDDEKWNFKKGRWEKDGGSTLWNGSIWMPS